MSVAKYLKLILFIVTATSALIINGSAGCGPQGHPIYDIVIENHTDQALTITTSQQGELGMVGPGETINAWYDTHFIGLKITARDNSDNVVLSATYYFTNQKYPLEKINKNTYRAVIETPIPSDNKTDSHKD